MSLINYDIGVRVQALSLFEYSVSAKEIEKWTGVSVSSLKRWKRVLRQRGFDPQVSSHILAQYVTDAPQSGRPSVLHNEAQKTIIKLLEKNSSIRQYSAAELVHNPVPASL